MKMYHQNILLSKFIHAYHVLILLPPFLFGLVNFDSLDTNDFR